MVIETIEKTDEFVSIIRKMKDKALKERARKSIIKIIEHPEIGKPMRYARKGTRELYLSPFRLAYAYIEEEHKIIFLALYHKDKQ